MKRGRRAKAPRRRFRPSLATRARVYWILIALLLCGAGYGGWTLATLPAFRAHSVDVSGLERVRRSDVLARAALDPAANVWLMNVSAVQGRIETIPYVGTARVHRSLPATVVIDVAERTPDACVRFADGSGVVVDRQFRVLEEGCSDRTLPEYVVHAQGSARPGAFLQDGELATLQRDADALKVAGQSYRRYERDAYGQLQATMAGGIAVRFGDDDDLAQKERLIGPILAQLGPRAAKVRFVDVRSPATPVVEYRSNPQARPPIHNF